MNPAAAIAARRLIESISELSVHCSGDGSSQRQQDHARAVTLQRP